jgi:hypothetical protein
MYRTSDLHARTPPCMQCRYPCAFRQVPLQYIAFHTDCRHSSQQGRNRRAAFLAHAADASAAALEDRGQRTDGRQVTSFAATAKKRPGGLPGSLDCRNAMERAGREEHDGEGRVSILRRAYSGQTSGIHVGRAGPGRVRSRWFTPATDSSHSAPHLPVLFVLAAPPAALPRGQKQTGRLARFSKWLLPWHRSLAGAETTRPPDNPTTRLLQTAGRRAMHGFHLSLHLFSARTPCQGNMNRPAAKSYTRLFICIRPEPSAALAPLHVRRRRRSWLHLAGPWLHALARRTINTGTV